ncbi:MAG: nucleotidyltransferase family protein [Deltaproteobacteria bacterium]|nr:nucleotidyltransferase family protein [Deltaproteobacteria bacterium]
MGRPKQHLLLKGKTVLQHSIEACVKAGLEDVIVVAGEVGKKELRLDNFLQAKFVFNKMPKSEMADSVRIGLQAIHNSSSGVLICLVDHPLVKVETFRLLTKYHEEESDKILIPVYNGIRGHPTLFPKTIVGEMFNPLANTDFNNDRRMPILRDLIAKNKKRVCLLEVDDEGVIIDMNTKQDYKRIIEKINAIIFGSGRENEKKK